MAAVGQGLVVGPRLPVQREAGQTPFGQMAMVLPAAPNEGGGARTRGSDVVASWLERWTICVRQMLEMSHRR